MKNLLSLFFTILVCAGYCQSIPFSYLNTNSENLSYYLTNNQNYWGEKKANHEYFQSKSGSTFIKIYKSVIVNVTIDFKNKTDYIKTLTEIRNKTIFQYKYCSDFESPVVYTYKTNFNTIRFNLYEYQISIQYNSELDSFFEENQHTFPVFVCPSYNSYAYHTNLRCNGLNNCNSDIYKFNLRDAQRSKKYKMCEICSSDD